MDTSFEQSASTETALPPGPRPLPLIGNVLATTGATGEEDAGGSAPAWDGLLYSNEDRQREYANIERKGCLNALLSLFMR